MSSRQRTLGHAAALMTILIWGTTFVSTKVLLRDFTPVTVLFTRFVIGYAFLWCLKPRVLPFSSWKKELLFASALCFLTWNRVVEILGAVKSSVYIYIIPVVTVVASAIILGERLTWISLAGIFLTLCGVTISEYRKKHGKAGRKGHPERKPVSPGPVPDIFPFAGKWTEPLPGHIRLMIFRSGQIFIYYSAGKIASGLDIR